MAKQTINIGSGELAGNGESIRSAFSKINDNFDELYTNGGVGGTGPQGPTGPSGAQGNIGPTGPAGTGGTSISTSDTAPLTPELGDLWYDTVSGRMYVYYDSGWVDANPSAVGPTGPQGVAGPTGPSGGDHPSWQLTSSTAVVSLDANGTLTVPYPSQESFRIRLSSENFVPRPGKATLTLTGDAWDFYGAFANSQDGERELIADNGPLPSIVNPGYEDGDTFEIDSTAHGIVGYVLTVELSNVVQAGPAGWTANLAFSQPPEYTSTVKSLGAVKLTANTNSLVLGTDGTVTVSGAVKQGINKLDLNENNNGNVYLTVTADDTTAVFMTPTGIQTYAKESVSLYAGTTLAATQQLWAEVEQVWVDVRDQDAAIIAPATRPWAGLPSYQAYDIILNTFPVEPAAPGNLVPAANDAKNAYNNWQNALSDTSVGIAVGNSSWAFAPSGTLTLPEPANVNFDAPSIRFGGATSVATNNYGFGVPGPAAGVVYNATTINLASMKLLITIEGQEDGGDGLYHTQVCEMLVVRRTGLTVDIVDSVVYGVLHTSLAPLATVTAQLSVDGRVEILAQPTNTTAIYVKVHATEVVRGD